ncbi:agmatinase [Desulfoferula mesophila]|uniref:Agmatinase n=1 Tax=Desulfoferula mesophila TaxID=3058419 RepID=A0AAU9ETF6_9BACT|nr:agmatinase [Desulfoferula mesophilus]
MSLLRSKILTFGGVRQPELERCRAAIIPAPLEVTVTYGEGAAQGPLAIMSASANMELYDEVLDASPIDQGIYTHGRINTSGTVQQSLENIRAAVAAELAAGRLPVVLGGEHTVTVGALWAMVERYGTDFTVLSLDAHLDMREDYEGECLSHATVMRRAWEMGLGVRWAGARSCSREEIDFLRSQGIEPLWAHQSHADPNWIDKALEGLTGPVYLTLDIDGLDSGIMPATGTPEPGGLSWQQATAWLTAVCARHQVLGLDLVELAPLAGQTAWDFTAARLLYRALGLIFRGTL